MSTKKISSVAGISTTTAVLLILVAVSAAATAATTTISSSYAQTIPSTFHAILEGDEEVPPVDSDAKGFAIFRTSNDETELNYKLVVANIEDVTAAHIHLAPEGENGDIL
jgi:hypothetical protein